MAEQRNNFACYRFQYVGKWVRRKGAYKAKGATAKIRMAKAATEIDSQ